MTGKRPHDAEGGDGDTKRARSNQGSPIPAQRNDLSEVERRKQEAAARIAAIKAKMNKSKPPTTTPAMLAAPQSPSPAPANGSGSEKDQRAAEAQRRIAEIKARMAASKGAAPSPVNGGLATPPSTQPTVDIQAKVAEAKVRAAALAINRQKDAPSPANAASRPPLPKPDKTQGRGGLSIGLHPSMVDDAATELSNDKAGQSGQITGITGGRQRPRVNPYLSTASDTKAEGGASYDTAIAAPRPGERKLRKIVFNEQGKWVAQANRLREQAELEDMKRKVAVETRKVQIEEAGDKVFLVPAPPKVEWWDEGLLPSGQDSYEDWDRPGRNKIETADSIITLLIQHPVVLAAPQDKLIPEAKPLMLTTTEQKKLRRQRRMVDMKEEQAKIRLGLVEPPPPKVKKSNMMRVLGEQAVKDPTAVEARVNREIEARAQAHNKDNTDRQLTDKQRHEKLEAQQTADAAKGIKIVVFRVDNLSSGKSRYQVDENAKQHALTGIVLLNPNYNLVIVEGGAHSIKAYKKLMLNRIKWEDNPVNLNSDKVPTTFTGTTDGSITDPNTGIKGAGSKAADWCNPYDENGKLKSLAGNRCVLVWEGEEPARVFKRWGSKACETDGEARDALSRQKMENMWTLAGAK